MSALHLASGAESFDLGSINAVLRDREPRAIVEWAIANAARPVLSTNFRPFSAALLHMVTRIKPDIPVIWVDSGYNTPGTYWFAEQIIQDLNLDIRIYTPRMTAARREALMGGVPGLDDPVRLEAFTFEVKLEPFERALDELKPDIWLTGIRREQTEYRKHLGVASRGPHGTLRIAPVFSWTQVDLEGYLYEHHLPDNEDYYDPTKVLEDRECGLQLLR
jgi:phosphoadenosine phosphosulfate reductase